MRPSLLALLALCTFLVTPSRVEAQRFENPNAASRKAGSPCNGFGFGGLFQRPNSPPMYLPTITQVATGGPGEAAGLMPGDTVVSVDKRDPLVDFKGFFAFTDTLTPHAFVVRRQGQTIQLSFVAGKLMDDPPSAGLPQQVRRCAATSVVRNSFQATIDAMVSAFQHRDTSAMAGLLDAAFHIGPIAGAGARQALWQVVTGSSMAGMTMRVDSVRRDGDRVLAYTTATTADRVRAAPMTLSADNKLVEIGLFSVTPTTPEGTPIAPRPKVLPSDTALYRRLMTLREIDQRHRGRIMELLGEGKRPGNSAEFDSVAALQRVLDAAVLDSLKAILRESGWPTPQRAGSDGVTAAFLITQHAPPAFQMEMQPTLERAASNGELPWSELALLVDRVLMSQGKNQKYGTQVTSRAGAAMSVWPIDDPANVDARRKAAGLGPLADYLSRFGIKWP